MTTLNEIANRLCLVDYDPIEGISDEAVDRLVDEIVVDLLRGGWLVQSGDEMFITDRYRLDASMMSSIMLASLDALVQGTVAPASDMTIN